MSRIERLFTVLRQKTKRYSRLPSSHPLENSPLAKLPTELLQQIASNLPVASAGSFSLSCRPILFLIGTKYLRNLATSPDDRLEFLKLLEHDLQEWIVCISCRQLHRIQDAKDYTRYNGRWWRPPPQIEPNCISDDDKAFVEYSIHERFSSTVFKMAIKNYRIFGNDARSRQLLNLLSGKSFPTYSWGCTREGGAECQIKNGSLFICKRIVHHGTCTNIKESSMYFSICPHLRLIGDRDPARLYITTLFSSIEKWSMSVQCENSIIMKKKPWDLWSELQQCRQCRTEYMVGFEHDGSCKIKFAITIWKDLGQGPETEEYKAHFGFEESNEPTVQFNGGEIASFFQATGTKL